MKTIEEASNENYSKTTKINRMEKMEKEIEFVKKQLVDLCQYPNYEEDDYNSGYIASICENVATIFKAAVEFSQKWISPDEEMPPHNENILFKDIYGNIHIGQVKNYRYWYSNDGLIEQVTHWRPVEFK